MMIPVSKDHVRVRVPLCTTFCLQLLQQVRDESGTVDRCDVLDCVPMRVMLIRLKVSAQAEWRIPVQGARV